MPNPINAEAMSCAESPFTPPGRARLTLAQWCGWLGLSAGATMLVGALAIWAATGASVRPKSPPEMPLPTRPYVIPTIRVEPSPPLFVPPKLEPRRHKSPSRPRQPLPVAVPGSAAVHCDGRDPLCGIDFGAVSDVGSKPHKSRSK